MLLCQHPCENVYSATVLVSKVSNRVVQRLVCWPGIRQRTSMTVSQTPDAHTSTAVPRYPFSRPDLLFSCSGDI
jgi:hypothetical protein